MADPVTSLTSDSEFTLVKRVQITNEVPPSSLYALMPSGLRNEFWKYFMGASEIAYEVPTGGSGTDIYSRAMKLVNGIESTTYGPTSVGELYHSINITGVLEPEIDLFLHELYRYLGHLYPDHPDYETLLTPIEINDALYAAASIIGYSPNYDFLGTWITSFLGGLTLSREALMWKIRDLRSAAYRRKFTGSYTGYKNIFSSMYRHGAVYLTGTYLPRTEDNLIDTSSRNLFRMFRLIDYLGAGDEVYRVNPVIVSFTGLIDPSDLFHVYESVDYTITSDTSPLSSITIGAKISDEDNNLIPYISGTEAGVVTQTQDTLPSGYTEDYIVHRLQLSSSVSPSLREYEITHISAETSLADLVPRPYGNALDEEEVTLGRFSLTPTLALEMYPTSETPMSLVSTIPFESSTLSPGDTITDSYTVGEVSYADIALIITANRGRIEASIQPDLAPEISESPSSTTLSGAFNISVPNYLNGSVVYNQVFLEGVLTYELDSEDTLTKATLTVCVVPAVNPITSNTHNREYFLSSGTYKGIAVGNAINIYQYNEDSSTWDLTNITSWVSGIDFGYLDTMELSHLGEIFPDSIPAPFTYENFAAWKARASSSFNTTLKNPRIVEIPGSISSEDPLEISPIGGAETLEKISALTIGETIFGPGLDDGTVITDINPTSGDIQISKEAVRFGSYTYQVVSHQSGIDAIDPKPFDFKNTLYTRYPTLTSSVFNFLEPSTIWPNSSLGFVEGVRDKTLYTYPVELPPGISRPSNIYFGRDLFLDLSLNRILYHENTLSLTSAGIYKSLCDLHWLDYLYICANNVRRATEPVHVGAQLNLVTDRSGLSTTIPGETYTDPNIEAKFITLPVNYDEDPRPLYLQLGTAGSAKESLFVTIDELTEDSGEVLPEIDSVFDQLEAPVFEVPIGEYENILGKSTPLDSSEDVYLDGLIDPSDSTENSYHVIQTSVYLQQFSNIGFSLRYDPLVLNSPALYTLKRLPSGTYDSTETAVFNYQGDWNPSAYVDNTTTPPTWDLTEPNWPDYTASTGDYFHVTQTATIGSYEFTKGDWIVWNGVYWETHTWDLQGLWGPDSPTLNDYYEISGTEIVTIGDYTFIPGEYIQWVATNTSYAWEISSTIPSSGTDQGTWSPTIDPGRVDSPLWPAMISFFPDPEINIHLGDTGADLDFILATQYPYFIVTKDCTFIDLAEGTILAANANDWLILTGTAEEPVWYIGNGQSYDALYSDIDRLNITTEEYETISENRIALLNATTYNYNLPRTFLAKGSCNFQFKINPNYTAQSTTGENYSLTSGPLLYDATQQLFYVEGSTIDDFVVTTEEGSFSFLVRISETETAQLQVRPSGGEAQRHYVKFREPTYFKNLGTLYGAVSDTDLTKVSKIEDFDFPTSQFSLTDSVIVSSEVKIRNSYSSTYENTFFNHYITLYGMIDQFDDTILNPITGTNSDSTYLSSFLSAKSHLTVSDSAWVFQSALTRLYDASYENKYYRNLLAIAGKVSKADPTTLRAIGTTGDDIRAFADAIALTVTGDETCGIFTLGGSVFADASSSLPFSVDGGYCTLSIECSQSTTPLWVAAGVNGQIAKSTDGSSWTLLTNLPSEWGTAAIRKVKFAMSEEGIGQWRIVGDNGMCAYSLDNTATWILDSLDGLGWGSSSIYDLEYIVGTPGTWMIVGADGKVAYLNKEYATVSGDWILSSLPGADGLPVDLPPNAPAEIPPGTSGVPAGWGTDTVRTISYGNGVCIVGGGENNAGTNVSSLLARSTNLTPLSGSAWIFSFLGEDWNDYYITSSCYGNGVWVVSGIYGKLAYSVDDAINWTTVTLPLAWNNADINHLSYEYGVWTAVGSSGKILTSVDGVTWTIGVTPSSLGTINLRASAHGNSTENGIEHILVGDSNEVAYSNSTANTSGSLVVFSPSPLDSSITFNADITTWGSEETEDKLVLVTLLTKRSIECELVGVPTAYIPVFSIGTKLALATSIEVFSYLQANRIFYPHLDPSFDLVPHIEGLTDEEIRDRAGYPLYSEDPTAYYLDSSSEPIEYKNSNQHTLYLCDNNGEYVNASYEAISILTFINYTTNGITQFSDSRQASYTPRYSTYLDWIENEGAFLLSDTITVSEDLAIVQDLPSAVSTVVFESSLPAIEEGYNSCIIHLMPSSISGTVPSSTQPTLATSTTLSNTTSGIYIPDGGYGTWINFDYDEDSRLPWETDPLSFVSPLTPLTNSLGAPVYLCNSDGTFKLEEGSPIQMMAPKYITFQELTIAEGRIIEGIALDFSLSTLTITDVDIDTDTLTFSDPLPLTFSDSTEIDDTRYVRLQLLTLASFEATEDNFNNSDIIYTLPQLLLSKYVPDRVCYLGSAYPSYIEDVSLYESDAFINSNEANVYSCDLSGNYITSSGAIVTTLDERSQPKMPKYLLCQDWYKDVEYLEGAENNPYWQYITVKDVFDSKIKTWSSIARVSRQIKSEKGTQLVHQNMAGEDDVYVEVNPSLGYSETSQALQVYPVEYIDHKAGIVSMILLGNKQYDPDWRIAQGLPEIEESFERYGIEFSSNFTLSNISSETELVHATISGDLLASYFTNTTKNFADPQDKKGSIVAITELGVFNIANKMIAYATFPPIIYDSVRHHLSLNLFIKQGYFPQPSS